MKIFNTAPKGPEVNDPQLNVPNTSPQGKLSKASLCHLIYSGLVILVTTIFVLFGLYQNYPTDTAQYQDDVVVFIAICILIASAAIVFLLVFGVRNGDFKKTSSYKKALIFMYISPPIYFLGLFVGFMMSIGCGLGHCSDSELKEMNNVIDIIFIIISLFPALAIFMGLKSLLSQKKFSYKALWIVISLIVIPILFYISIIKTPALLKHFDLDKYYDQLEFDILSTGDSSRCPSLLGGNTSVFSCYEKLGVKLDKEVCEAIAKEASEYVSGDCFRQIGDCDTALIFHEYQGHLCFFETARKNGNPEVCKQGMEAVKNKWVSLGEEGAYEKAKLFGGDCYTGLAETTRDFQYCEEAFMLSGNTGDSKLSRSYFCQEVYSEYIQ